MLMLRYINEYGWSELKVSSGSLPTTADLHYETQQVLDACIWYYNRKWHKGIKAIPYEVFNGYDLNHGDVNIIEYDMAPPGTIVLRKPTRERGKIKLNVFGFDPEPFVINKVEAGKQGKYQIRSLVTGDIVRRWYKPYELRTFFRGKPLEAHKALGEYVNKYLVKKYLKAKYGDEMLNEFLSKFKKS
jgi:hypothetical protein